MSDLISREAICNECMIEKGGKGCWACLVNDAPTVDTVEVILKQWISVEDKLPKSGERVLFSDGVFVGEGYMGASGKWTRYNGKISAACIDVYDITHWMPLPEPPEEVSE